jgi:hypothetical protein
MIAEKIYSQASGEATIRLVSATNNPPDFHYLVKSEASSIREVLVGFGQSLRQHF